MTQINIGITQPVYFALNLIIMKCIPVLFSLMISVVTLAQQPDIQAHRGGRGLMPENTIPAMLHAVQLGVRTLELDCVISADGKVVVSHDLYMSSDFMLQPNGDTIAKKEEKNYALYKMTYDSIRLFDAGSKPHPGFPRQQKIKTCKPLLADLIDSVEAYVQQHGLKKVYYNIETKCSPETDGTYHPAPEKFVELLLAVVKQKHIQDRVTIQSFDPRTLRIVHRDYPGMSTSLLIANKESLENNIRVLGYTPAVYSPHYLLVTADLVEKAHALHIQVLPWTVNDEASIKKMADLKVDGIISDYPDKLVALLGSYQ
jgi:glycerophosphoryl diester phosphodiesterase